MKSGPDFGPFFEKNFFKAGFHGFLAIKKQPPLHVPTEISPYTPSLLAPHASSRGCVGVFCLLGRKMYARDSMWFGAEWTKALGYGWFRLCFWVVGFSEVRVTEREWT